MTKCLITDQILIRGNTREHGLDTHHGEGSLRRNENANKTAGLQRSKKLRLFDMQRTRVLAIKRSFLLSQAQV